MYTSNSRRDPIGHRLLLLAILACLGCQKKEKPAEGPSERASHPAAAAARPPAVPVPDANSFFPLIEGSYWSYRTIENGEAKAGETATDSIVSVRKTDSGYLAIRLDRDVDGTLDTTWFRTDLNGIVWKRRKGWDGFEPYAAISPKPGDKVGSRSFFPCAGTDSAGERCVLLQEYPGDGDGLTEEQKAGWTGLYFKRGIGLESNAGVEISDDLFEYRIGPSGAGIRVSH